ncbi:TPA: zinc-binding dehydrogenase [Streptococcus pneumoniae]|uniref:zinc-binding dehydrogenase n=1 Tax=Streptococcus pneumoniae TaxID=1313 RepID=UPI000B597986|nr:zinc-binding dehydrogenase [Streptococcus pneumoniae]SND45615.1 zinc-containing alcohol dehydrogenase [Streptococcus pneumoniae]SND84415.1 zinc-containing alcohol dehydrogenase [Streptococcus pneumoniae]VMV70295.1 zinc-containing alcohol dehydrogenase [Streptococcus pneumoniae]HEX0888323.1 zinc-binding dehydrogenase [Streptococcus pneumoniae]
MKSAVYTKAGQVGLASIERPQIIEADDVIIRVVRACVCGSDLWRYRNPETKAGHKNSGHEAIGIVEEAGEAITTVKPGDFQAEYIRFHYANWALVKIPGQPSDYTEGMLKSLLTLADVMPTGYHAARVANVQKGDKVVVIGDGAVGQCAVIAAKMRGASQIILMSRHEDRQKMAMESGATAVVAERGQEGITKVREILGGGADAALECVGTEAAIEQALGVLHNGGRMGFVGVPHYNNRALGSTFMQNISVAGGAASATTYDKQFLLKVVLDGDINPGRVFTSSYKLEDIDQAYKDMDERKTIKSMIVIE